MGKDQSRSKCKDTKWETEILRIVKRHYEERRERECRRKMICEKEGRLRASGVRDKRLRE